MIRLVNAPSLLVQGIQETVKEKLQTPNFLRSFFVASRTAAIQVSTETIRKSAIVAVDRQRNAGAQVNRADRSTIKQFETPFYNEGFNITDLDSYTRLAGQADFISEAELDALVDESNEKLVDLQTKIERAYEIQCSQALFDRALTFDSMDGITFNPKAESTIAASANGGVWSDVANDIVQSIKAACEFSATVGNASTGVFNLVANGDVIEQIKENEKIQKRSDLKNMSLVDLVMPEYVTTSGAAYHGLLSAGAYKVHLWSYGTKYDLAGSKVGFLPANKACIFPSEPDFKFRYAGVSQYDEKAQMYLPKKGDYHIRMLNDTKAQATSIEIASSGLAIPYLVDQIAVINTAA